MPSWNFDVLPNVGQASVDALAGYVFAAQGTQHVVYLGEDSNIYELW